MPYPKRMSALEELHGRIETIKSQMEHATERATEHDGHAAKARAEASNLERLHAEYTALLTLALKANGIGTHADLRRA